MRLPPSQFSVSVLRRYLFLVGSIGWAELGAVQETEARFCICEQGLSQPGCEHLTRGYPGYGIGPIHNHAHHSVGISLRRMYPGIKGTYTVCP